MKKTLAVRARLAGAAFFGWIGYRLAPREVRPFMLAGFQLVAGFEELEKERTWGVLIAPWYLDDEGCRLSLEMARQARETCADYRRGIIYASRLREAALRPAL